MTGTQFEQYAATVLRNVGYRVSSTPASGDYGVDLIAKRNGTRHHGADESIPPGASFEAPGDPDWANQPFEGSGPDPKYWWGTSEDYVDSHERPDFVELTDRPTDRTRFGPKEEPRP